MGDGYRMGYGDFSICALISDVNASVLTILVMGVVLRMVFWFSIGATVCFQDS